MSACADGSCRAPSRCTTAGTEPRKPRPSAAFAASGRGFRRGACETQPQCGRGKPPAGAAKPPQRRRKAPPDDASRRPSGLHLLLRDGPCAWRWPVDSGPREPHIGALGSRCTSCRRRPTLRGHSREFIRRGLDAGPFQRSRCGPILPARPRTRPLLPGHDAPPRTGGREPRPGALTIPVHEPSAKADITFLVPRLQSPGPDARLTSPTPPRHRRPSVPSYPRTSAPSYPRTSPHAPAAPAAPAAAAKSTSGVKSSPGLMKRSLSSAYCRSCRSR